MCLAFIAFFTFSTTVWAQHTLAAKTAERRAEVDNLIAQLQSGAIPVTTAVSKIEFTGETAYAARVLSEFVSPGMNPQIRRDATQAMALCADRSAEKPLLRLVKDDDGAVRMWAVKGLGLIKSTAAIAALTSALGDETIGVRKAAAVSLGTIGDPHAGTRLIQAAKTEGDVEVRQAMLLAVGQVKDRSQIEALRTFLNHSSELTRNAAATALCLLNSNLQEPKETFLKTLEHLDFSTRVLKVSEEFLGRKYVLSPLGECAPPDADPRFRFDAFDCVTFVEEVMALSAEPSGEGWKQKLEEIRYSEEPRDYNHRNHITEAQWIPNNISKEYLRPISPQSLGVSAFSTLKHLDAQSWQFPAAQKLQLPDFAQVKGDFPLALVANSEEAIAALERVRVPAVMTIVHEDHPDRITIVSHVALLVPKNPKTVVRHASSLHHQVTEESVADFVKRQSTHGKWPVMGFGIFELLPPKHHAP